jgi:hypothetical protein
MFENLNDVSFLSIIPFISVVCIIKTIISNKNKPKKYQGYCHCKNIIFNVLATSHLVVWNCNCSICKMKKNYHFIVPSKNFELLSGKDELSEYKFNTKVARHLFCKNCGVQAFYHPR